ncbi:hypothetical protein Q3O98_03850 [Ralstonia pseudosolanacearum]|uniref:hypothetical protein n=1 Tax=Ralstonia pseudosolanacearum TaxID=1310165 RepID=UPI002674B5C9|nr:hypothetical protein [Ralstonia pseudosolanacearum]MDO3620226.1 hypothetical protein [Ralstonia pseudosolanacearum]
MSQTEAPARVPVSERAVLQRLNRALAKEGVTIRVCKETSRWFHGNGRYYAVDLNRNLITAQHVNIELWARDEGVLKPFEAMAA